MTTDKLTPQFQVYDRTQYRYLVKTEQGARWSWFKTDGTRMTQEDAEKELALWRVFSTNEYVIVKHR